MMRLGWVRPPGGEGVEGRVRSSELSVNSVPSPTVSSIHPSIHHRRKNVPSKIQYAVANKLIPGIELRPSAVASGATPLETIEPDRQDTRQQPDPGSTPAQETPEPQGWDGLALIYLHKGKRSIP